MSKFAQFHTAIAELRSQFNQQLSLLEKSIPKTTVLEPRGKLYERKKSKTTTVKAASKQLDLPVSFMTKAEVKKALPQRDQSVNGTKGFKEHVTVDIMRAAAYTAVNNHLHGKSVKGEFSYAPNAPEHFHQFGDARVINHTATHITVRAVWLNCHRSNVTVKTGETIAPMIFSHTLAEWQAMWPVVKKLLHNPKHKSNLFRVSTAK